MNRKIKGEDAAELKALIDSYAPREKVERIPREEQAVMICTELMKAGLVRSGHRPEAIKAIEIGLAKIAEGQAETKTLQEVQQIVDAVKAGIDVEINPTEPGEKDQ